MMSGKIVLTTQEQRLERALVTYTLGVNKGNLKRGFWQVCGDARRVTATTEYCTFFDQKGMLKYLDGNEYSFQVYPLDDDGKLYPESQQAVAESQKSEEKQISIFDLLEEVTNE